MKQIIARNVRQDTGGATIVEFSIALLAFVFLFLILTDFARYVEAKGVLNTGALDAIALATTIPGLEIAERDDPTYILADAEVRQRALVFPEGTLFSGGSSNIKIESIIVSDPNNPPDPSNPSPFEGCADGDRVCLIVPPPEELLKEPIKIVIRGTYDPIFPGAPNLPITVMATAFREPETSSSMPLLADCNGNRYGSPDYFQNCSSSCSPEQMWDRDLRRCICRSWNGFIDDGNGGCVCDTDKGYQEIPDNSEYCLCPEARRTPCPDGKTFSEPACACACRDDAGWQGDTFSACESGNNVVNGSWDYNTCSCKCDGTGQTDNQAGDGCECAAGYHAVDKQCVRDSDPNNPGTPE